MPGTPGNGGQRMPDEGFLTVPEVAERLRVKPDAVRRWIRLGRLRAHMLGGTKTGYRVSEADLEHFIQRSATDRKRKAAA
jgi:excisionase family DNA binding protein